MSSPYLAPTGQYYTFIPLMAILTLTACKELLEDYVRSRAGAMSASGARRRAPSSLCPKKPQTQTTNPSFPNRQP